MTIVTWLKGVSAITAPELPEPGKSTFRAVLVTPVVVLVVMPLVLLGMGSLIAGLAAAGAVNWFCSLSWRERAARRRARE